MLAQRWFWSSWLHIKLRHQTSVGLWLLLMNYIDINKVALQMLNGR